MDKVVRVALADYPRKAPQLQHRPACQEPSISRRGAVAFFSPDALKRQR
jgi:hypothetical protein